MKKVVVIGGNAAGLSAASQVKRLKPDWEAVVLEKGRYISFAACGMPYYIEGIVPEFDSLFELNPSEVEKRGIDLRLGWRVTRVNPTAGEVEVESPDGHSKEPFDFLVIASGAAPMTEGIQFKPSERVYTLKGMDDAAQILSFIENNKPENCAVIGGGYIAVEMVEAFKTRGLETHLIHRRKDLARTFEIEISDRIKEKMEQEGVILNLNTGVQAIEEEAEKAVVITNDNRKLAFDLVLVAAGVQPVTDFLQGSGIELGIKNAVRVNTFLQTNVENIYAAGDCAETFNRITGQPAYVPLALKANREGMMAGANICGKPEPFPGILGSAITKIFDLGIARTGLTLEEAEKYGLNPVKYQVSNNSRARYYPGTGTLESVIVASKNDGRLLGAQLAGPLDAVKRIDVYATILYAGMTVSEAFNLDLSYAPPFSPVYDPVVMAARVGRKHVQ